MSQTALYHFLISVPEAAAIWSFLLLLALGLLAALVARPERDPAPEGAPEPADPDAARRDDLIRYAEEVAVAAAGATQTARRRRERWLAAQDEADRAWTAYDEADAAARRLGGAAALAAPRTPRTPAEYAARERWLHHAAMTAHWRDDLTARQLADVLARRNGWDPRRHPAEQEIILARTVRDGRRAGWEIADARERAAWRDVELAAEAARTLAAEAYAAAVALRPAPACASATTRPLPVPASVRNARWRPARVG
ncbi:MULTISPECIES: hypothetical protein [unclassified Micromonospora]|uniref:hypothetical protein n=1 Tax=unclassified Micromonospora TaxID=2617518 RepID=UPI001C22C522|nr:MULTISPECIES: hypothetical protein [unclassified Micromonospora]MBU8859881.1 hypothetical protein [Micromonospora sp. WMMB482]MDM4779405.1 hypothetical protein [Micromonospora sp. b486]